MAHTPLTLTASFGMDAPILALRFRDPGTVDTISEHRNVLLAEGSVWWGWWKKETEPFRSDLFEVLPSPSTILLIDRSTGRSFITTCLKVRKGNDHDVDASRIPGYYRDKREDVAAWFLLSKSIESTPYQESVDRKFANAGNVTLLSLRDLPGASFGSAELRRREVTRSGVLHLSDLHFGSDYSFLEPGFQRKVGDDRCTITEAILQDLVRVGAENSIGLVLVTGDFTTRGDWSDETRNQILQEFTNLRTALGIHPEQIVAVPGNHDVIRYPDGKVVDPNTIVVEKQKTYKHEREFRTFLDELTGRSWKDPLNYFAQYRLPAVDIDIVALNSCSIAATSWTEYGYVGVGGYDVLRNLKDSVCSRPTYRIVALHHHLLPVSHVDTPSNTGVSLTLDAVELLDVAANAGVQLVVHGHQHLARVARYENVARVGERNGTRLTIVSGGSAGVVEPRRGFERNTYSLFEFSDQSIHLRLRELRPDGRQGATLFDVDLGVPPTAPGENPDQ